MPPTGGTGPPRGQRRVVAALPREGDMPGDLRREAHAQVDILVRRPFPDECRSYVTTRTTKRVVGHEGDPLPIGRPIRVVSDPPVFGAVGEPRRRRVLLVAGQHRHNVGWPGQGLPLEVRDPAVGARLRRHILVCAVAAHVRQLPREGDLAAVAAVGAAHGKQMAGPLVGAPVEGLH